MYCTNCGKEIKEGNKFCTNCGKPLKNLSKNNIQKVEVNDNIEDYGISKKDMVIITIFIIFLMGFAIFLLVKQGVIKIGGFNI